MRKQILKKCKLGLFLFIFSWTALWSGPSSANTFQQVKDAFQKMEKTLEDTQKKGDKGDKHFEPLRLLADYILADYDEALLLGLAALVFEGKQKRPLDTLIDLSRYVFLAPNQEDSEWVATVLENLQLAINSMNKKEVTNLRTQIRVNLDGLEKRLAKDIKMLGVTQRIEFEARDKFYTLIYAAPAYEKFNELFEDAVGLESEEGELSDDSLDASQEGEKPQKDNPKGTKPPVKKDDKSHKPKNKK